MSWCYWSCLDKSGAQVRGTWTTLEGLDWVRAWLELPARWRLDFIGLGWEYRHGVFKKETRSKPDAKVRRPDGGVVVMYSPTVGMGPTISGCLNVKQGFFGSAFELGKDRS